MLTTRNDVYDEVESDLVHALKALDASVRHTRESANLRILGSYERKDIRDVLENALKEVRLIKAAGDSIVRMKEAS